MEQAQRDTPLDRIRSVCRLNVSGDVLFVYSQNDEGPTQLFSPNSLTHMRVCHAHEVYLMKRQNACGVSLTPWRSERPAAAPAWQKARSTARPLFDKGKGKLDGLDRVFCLV
jgi:hypothetical protein